MATPRVRLLHRWPLRSKRWIFNLASKVCAVRSLYWGITMPLQAPTLWIWLGFDKGFLDGERCWDMGHWDGFWFPNAVGRPLGCFRHRNWWSAVLDPHISPPWATRFSHGMNMDEPPVIESDSVLNPSFGPSRLPSRLVVLAYPLHPYFCYICVLHPILKSPYPLLTKLFKHLFTLVAWFTFKTWWFSIAMLNYHGPHYQQWST